MKVLIAGAGIGGLTAAACLLKAGRQVRVYEQAPSLGEIGAGVQLSANAVKVLYDLGLRDALEAVAVRPHAFHFRRFDTGERLHEIPLADTHEQANGAPYYHIHRADLHALLARRVFELDPYCIRLNARAEGYAEDAQGVTLMLSGGPSASGDVLIGADGIKSRVRRQVIGDTPAIYTGDVAWRAVIPASRLPAGYMDKVVTIWCGPKRHAVAYFLRRGEVLNFGGCVERAQAGGESWTLRRPWEELKADFAGWHGDIQTAIDAIDRDSCYQWALFNREPAANWSTARATLLGDAAHPTLPYMAQGVAMAIEDAAVLARCLDGATPVAQALGRYQRNRIARTTRIVMESTGMRSLYRMEDAEEMRRSFHERNLARSRGEWLYSYDPLRVPLQ
jgi:salicylate hydroxylase